MFFVYSVKNSVRIVTECAQAFLLFAHVLQPLFYRQKHSPSAIMYPEGIDDLYLLGDSLSLWDEEEI